MSQELSVSRMFGCSDNRNEDCESCDKATAGKEEKSTEKSTSKRCGLGSAIGSAMLGSKMSAMAINGRKLVMGIEILGSIRIFLKRFGALAYLPLLPVR